MSMPSKAKQPTSRHKYRFQFVPSAWAEWQKLDGSVKESLRKLLKKGLDNPHGFCRVSGVWPKNVVSLTAFSSSKAVELIRCGHG